MDRRPAVICDRTSTTRPWTINCDPLTTSGNSVGAITVARTGVATPRDKAHVPRHNAHVKRRARILRLKPEATPSFRLKPEATWRLREATFTLLEAGKRLAWLPVNVGRVLWTRLEAGLKRPGWSRIFPPPT